MSDYILEMKQISKEFSGFKALEDVNFKVGQGEIHCLIGENGAGKSTLMKVLSGVYPYGRIKVISSLKAIFSNSIKLMTVSKLELLLFIKNLRCSQT